jgi:hypothetical protein
MTRYTRLQSLRLLHDCSDCFRLEQHRRVGLAPTVKRRLCTTHTLNGHTGFFLKLPGGTYCVEKTRKPDKAEFQSKDIFSKSAILIRRMKQYEDLYPEFVYI